jgi:hypothetical protein
LLQTYTLMKLLTTIAAVLISISAFSQDYVEYNEGGFSMNGEEISHKQVYQWMKQYQVEGHQRLKVDPKKSMKNCENEFRRNGIAAGAVIGTPVMALLTGIFGFSTYIFAEEIALGGTVTLGVITVSCAGLTVMLPYEAYIQSNKGRCLNRIDNNIRPIIENLNEAIQLQINK